MNLTQLAVERWNNDRKSFDSARWTRWAMGTITFSVVIGTVYGYLTVILG